ncbi:LuxR C-terminal-related transcriptional regulator [Monashia sp. NPDC004114]
MGSAFGTRFVGRERELGDLRHLMAVNRVVTLAGFGGVGKTRLAARVVDEIGPGYADGAFLVALGELSDAALLGHTVAGALGLQVSGTEWNAAVLTDFLRDRRALLWLDNCEHLVGSMAPLVADVMRECPGVAVIGTSRMPLGLAGEVVYDVPPMQVPPLGHSGGQGGSPEELMAFDAVALFVDRARLASESFRLVPDNAAAVAELVGELDGIPLAVELAAARIRSAAPQVMVRRMHELRLADGRLVDAPARHHSMAASMEWSYRFCTPEEQAVWRRLSVFVGGFDIDAAEVVCAAGTITSSDVLGLLMSLADKSLIFADPDAPGRYRMLEPMRQYGARQAKDTGDLATSRDAHLAWSESLTAEMVAHWSGPHQPRWMSRLRREHSNLRAALEHAVADPATSPAALRMCRDLEPFWTTEGAFDEPRHWADLALAQPTGSPAERARTASMAGWLSAPQLDLEYSRARLAEAAGLIGILDEHAHGDRHTHLSTEGWGPECLVRTDHLFGLGTLALYSGGPGEAGDHYTTVVAELDRTGHAAGYGYLQAMLVIGFARLAAGDLAEATRVCTQTLALSEARGELVNRATSNWVLGLISLNTGDLATAENHELQALRCARELDDRFQTAQSTESLGWVQAALGRGVAAATLLGAADGLWRFIHMPPDATPFAAYRTAAAAQATAAAGPEAYAAAFARGLGMDASAAAAFAEQAVAAGQGAAAAPTPDGAAYDPLTPREAAVAGLVADGLSNRQIAEKLVISERTVHGHIRNILTKLDATSRAKIASWYVQQAKGGAAQNETTASHRRTAD